MHTPHYSTLDNLIIEFDQLLRSTHDPSSSTCRQSPAIEVEQGILNESERHLSAALMRINHAGEVSAQALYQGQSLAARNPDIRIIMKRSAEEEVDHLAWCSERVKELGGHTSYLNPLWYLGSLTIGTFAGIVGDKWSLGFIAETERQVVQHLQGHFNRLPSADAKSRAILQQMAEDEAHHGTIAMATGGIELPEPIKLGMQLCSKVMTKTAYWI